jgi:hypothetical protein
MKYIDVRFNEEEINFIKEMVGTTLTKVKCDYSYIPCRAYGFVGVITDKNTYEFSNQIQVMDFFGDKEDVADFRLRSCLESQIKSAFLNGKLKDVPINKIIKEIDVVNEHQKLFENEIQTYDVWVTRGVIFKLIDGEEVSIEKSVWFSEVIELERGVNLLNKFTPVEEFAEEFTEDCRGECSRTVVTYKNENL